MGYTTHDTLHSVWHFEAPQAAASQQAVLICNVNQFNQGLLDLIFFKQ